MTWKKPHTCLRRSRHNSPIPEPKSGTKASSILQAAGLKLTPSQVIEHSHVYLAPDGTFFGGTGYTHRTMAGMAFPGSRRIETEAEDKMIDVGFIRFFNWGKSVPRGMLWYQPTSEQLASLEDLSVRGGINISTEKGDFDYDGLKAYLERGGHF